MINPSWLKFTLEAPGLDTNFHHPLLKFEKLINNWKTITMENNQ